MGPCYGYSQSHMSPNGRQHNHWCTIRARIVLCLYDRTIQLQQSHKWNQQRWTDLYSKHVGAAQMLLLVLRMTTRYTCTSSKLKQQRGEIFLCNISKQHIPVLLFYCSVGGEDKKKTFPGSKLQHSLVSPVVTRCWGEVYISILSFNYHILRMEGIACQLSWQKKIKHEPMGILHNGEAEIEIVFFLLELKFLYTYKVPNSVLNKLSTSPLPI